MPTAIAGGRTPAYSVQIERSHRRILSRRGRSHVDRRTRRPSRIVRMDSQSTGKTFPRLARTARWLVAAAGAAMLIAGWRLESVLLPTTHWRLDGRWLAAVGAVVLVIAWALRFWAAQWALAAAIFLWAALAAAALGYRAPQRGDVQVLSDKPIAWTSEKEWNDPYMEADPRYGYRNRRQTAARHHHRDFDVVYHTDANGWRRTAHRPEARQGREIAVVGCSFTFGFGVADDAHYTAWLANQAWPERRVGNYSVLGWGTAHAALVVEDLLARPDPPGCILYGWLGKHRLRNYRRRVIRESATFDFPLFDFEGNQLRYHGLVPVAENTWDDGPNLDEQERRISVELLRKMQRGCSARGVEFFVLALESNGQDTVLNEVLAAGDVNVIDLSRVSRDYLPTDDHPAPSWHQKIARAISRLDILAERLGDTAWRNPNAIPRREEDWWLSLHRDAGADARLERLPGQPPRVRLTPSPATDSIGGVELHRFVSVTGGRLYRLETRLRADRTRDVLFVLSQAHPPWKGSERPKLVQVGPNWTNVSLEFQAEEDYPEAKLALLVGKSSVPIEVTGTRLWLDDCDVLAEEPEVVVHLATDQQPPQRDSSDSARAQRPSTDNGDR